MPDLNVIIDSMRAELIDFCARLLQTPSVNGVHDEVAIASVIAAEAQKLGLRAQIAGENLRRPNVIVNVGQSDPGLLLIGHLDTVPVGDESRWSHPPFGGKIADGKLYGRGAVDTKGGMAAAVYALAALQRVHPEISAAFIGVPDEESGATGTLGIKWLHDHGMLRGCGAIYAYSGSEIIVGHRGLFRCKVTCTGESAHPGFAAWQNRERGANAVTAMARLLIDLEDMSFEFSTTPHFDPYRTMVITPGTTIHGGAAINIVPDACEATIDVRITPEHTPAHAQAIIDMAARQLEAENARIHFEITLLNALPAAVSDPNARIFSALERATAQVRGIMPVRTAAGPANEGYLLIERGIPTVCGFGVIGEGAHSIDEYVEIDSLPETARIFALTALDMMQA